MALYSEPYGTPADVKIKLSDLGLTQYEDYDLFESFSGTHIGKFQKTDSYSFSINPSGDVQAFYAQQAATKKNFRRHL